MKMNLSLPANYTELPKEEQVKVRAAAVQARKAEKKIEAKELRARIEQRDANRHANIVLGKIAATDAGRARSKKWLENHGFTIEA